MTSERSIRLLAEARVAYAASLPARLARIGELWAQARQGGESEPLVTMEREAHSIAGSSGTFGMPAVGDAARALEAAIPSRDAPAIAEALAELERVTVDALR